VNDDFRLRLRLIMQQFGSVADLARAVGVSDNAIYKWVAGRGQPSMTSLVSLAKAARVSVEWLATGHDAARAQAPVGDRGEYVFFPRQSVRLQAGRTALQSPQIVDYVALKADWLRRRFNADPKELMLIEAVGDSMSPTIDEGDVVLIDLREPRFRHDGIYALRSGADIAVKRVQRRPDGKLVVRSDNPAYEPAIVTPESIAVLGYVIWIGGRL
jgi:phage repressor protein C with HTH and peptisase S24 domain